MFLSLLKVVAISIISAVSFRGVAERSTVPHNYDRSAISQKVNPKKLNVVEGDFLSINFDDMSYFHSINSSNIEIDTDALNYLNFFDFTLFDYDFVHANFTTNTNTYDYYFDYFGVGRSLWLALDKLCLMQNYQGAIHSQDGSHILEYDFAHGTITYYQYRGVFLTNINDMANYTPYLIEGVISSTIHYVPDAVAPDVDYYFNIYVMDAIADYVYNRFSITLNAADLNTVVFYNTAEYLSNLWVNDHNAFKSFRLETSYDGIDIKSNAKGTDWFFYTDTFSNIFLQLNLKYQEFQPLGDYLQGFWCIQDNRYSGAIIYQDFSQPLYIKVGNPSYYQELYSTIQTDLTGNPSVNYDEGYNYTFPVNINFNAPFNTSAEMNVVAISSFVQGGVTTYIFDIYLPEFISNGYLFNKIELKYVSAYDKYFRLYDAETDSEGIRYFNMYGYGFFYSMTYVNENSGLHIVALQRDVSYVGTSDNVVPYYSLTCSWVNNNYRTLSFARELRSYELDRLTIFNTPYDQVTSVGGGGSLATCFRLINNTLIGLSGFFGIEILPGITLGVLALMPFAVSLMLFVIHLFKR